MISKGGGHAASHVRVRNTQVNGPQVARGIVQPPSTDRNLTVSLGEVATRYQDGASSPSVETKIVVVSSNSAPSALTSRQRTVASPGARTLTSKRKSFCVPGS